MIKKILISLLAGVIIVVLISLAQIGYYKYFPRYQTRSAPPSFPVPMIAMHKVNLGFPFVYARSCVEMVCDSITYPIFWFILDALIWGLIVFLVISSIVKLRHGPNIKNI